MTDVITEHIEIVEGAGGPKARIRGHRIRVMDVAIWHEHLGMTLEEIISEFPTITLADVQAVLAYYREHRDEIEQHIADDQAFYEEMKRKNPSRVQMRLNEMMGW